MNKKYSGYIKIKNKWEDFTSDNLEDARPCNSGYDKVIDLETDEEIK